MSTRASVDLPEPEGPKTAVTVPEGTLRLIFLRIGSARPDAVANTLCSVISPVGATRFSAGSRGG